MAQSISYGVPTDRCGLQLRLGIEKGFFREHGIDLSLRVVFGGPEIAAEFDSGRLKIGELGTPPALTALGKGARFKVVGSGVRRGAVQYFVARPHLSAWSEPQRLEVGCIESGELQRLVHARSASASWSRPRDGRDHRRSRSTLPGNPHVAGARRSRWSDRFGAACHDRRAGRTLQGMARPQHVGCRPPDAVDHSGRERRSAGSVNAISSRPCFAVVAAAIDMPPTIEPNGQTSAPAISASRATRWRSRSIANLTICISTVRSIKTAWRRRIALQRKLGSVTGPLRLADILAPGFDTGSSDDAGIRHRNPAAASSDTC